jgi:hypothetical protein
MSTSLEVETKANTKRGRTKAPNSRVLSREELDAHVHQELQRLSTMERGALRVLWEELFGVLPNPRLRRELLILVLTYRIQEKAYGDIKLSTRKKLLSYAEVFTKEKEVVPVRDRVTKLGTRIVREWGNKLHEVVVVASGYTYDGKQYRSLSEIAREITGTRWSGPAFFGLKKRGKEVAA